MDPKDIGKKIGEILVFGIPAAYQVCPAREPEPHVGHCQPVPAPSQVVDKNQTMVSTTTTTTTTPPPRGMEYVHSI